MAGAGASIVLTFAVMAYFVRDPRLRAAPRVKLLAPMPRLEAAVRLLAVVAFLLALAAGFFGAQDPYRNLIVTLVWVVWWVGFAFVCALLGNLWALANPLATLFEWAERLCGRRTPAGGWAYPAWLGAWPAVLLFFAFAWAELVWRDKDVPFFLASAVAAYALVTWTGMFFFGRELWLERGEAFSVAFGILGRFAPLEGAQGGLRLRPPGAGLIAERPLPFSLLAFVLLMLASVSFDGFLETPLSQQLSTAVQGSPGLSRLLFGLSELGLQENEVIASAALLAFPLVFLAAYGLACWAMTRLTRGVSLSQAAGAFVLSLVPIAVAYHLAHYFSLLLTAGQFIIPLASDPFGLGWNLFGSAGYKVDLGIVSPYVFWYGAVALVVIGHAIAVFVAHLEAARVFASRRDALVGQAPLLVLMVAYTMLSLWILAQPIVG